MKTLLRSMTVLVTAGFTISSSPCQVAWTQKRVLSGQGCPMAFDSTTGRALAFSGLGETYERPQATSNDLAAPSGSTN
ncbi:MAG: hypothetical protein H6832_01625 [Planctomycetes bacterium]|nr:hypothetical protein [Planctomycetota bacterium]MCB9917086.1 hypothetical protein [Planctomycetota bacterium]